MNRTRVSSTLWTFAMLTVVLALGCDGVSISGLGSILNGNGNDTGGSDANDNSGGDGPTARASLEVHASNTAGASGMALRRSDGALFIVNPDGLFGPIEDGADVSALTPLGATNLAADAFTFSGTALVLAISPAGEFWIGSPCCGILAIVPPEGGDAAPFQGLLDSDANIFSETLVFVPDGFDGPQMHPGHLLVGENTTFSRLAAIDVAGDRTTIPMVENPALLDREAMHLTFGPGPTLYSSRGIASPDILGIQTIAEDGTPTGVAGTLRLGIKSFIVRENGDLVMRGTQDLGRGEQFSGILLWSAADEQVEQGLELPDRDLSEDDEMITTADRGTIFLSLPARNEIVRVVVD